mmetsp:Transcript_40389/g.87427  ORF Transcript_40389/g.87427 Transcript_40389/m.87427 type:complete len:226 (+) Transcript_40389:223-900(+)
MPPVASITSAAPSFALSTPSPKPAWRRCFIASPPLSCSFSVHAMDGLDFRVGASMSSQSSSSSMRAAEPGPGRGLERLSRLDWGTAGACDDGLGGMTSGRLRGTACLVVANVRSKDILALIRSPPSSDTTETTRLKVFNGTSQASPGAKSSVTSVSALGFHRCSHSERIRGFVPARLSLIMILPFGRSNQGGNTNLRSREPTLILSSGKDFPPQSTTRTLASSCQ